MTHEFTLRNLQPFCASISTRILEREIELVFGVNLCANKSCVSLTWSNEQDFYASKSSSISQSFTGGSASEGESGRNPRGEAQEELVLL